MAVLLKKLRPTVQRAISTDKLPKIWVNIQNSAFKRSTLQLLATSCSEQQETIIRTLFS